MKRTIIALILSLISINSFAQSEDFSETIKVGQAISGQYKLVKKNKDFCHPEMKIEFKSGDFGYACQTAAGGNRLLINDIKGNSLRKLSCIDQGQKGNMNDYFSSTVYETRSFEEGQSKTIRFRSGKSRMLLGPKWTYTESYSLTGNTLKLKMDDRDNQAESAECLYIKTK